MRSKDSKKKNLKKKCIYETKIRLIKNNEMLTRQDLSFLHLYTHEYIFTFYYIYNFIC